ncbi:hypothetical protein Tco_0494460 [Tanacetum coccineum]
MGGIVDDSLVNPKTSSQETMDQYDSLLKGWIFGSASENVLGAVVDLASAKDVWDKLKSFYDVTVSHQQGINLNAFIRIADPRKVRIVERPRAENERPIVTVAKHSTCDPNFRPPWDLIPLLVRILLSHPCLLLNLLKLKFLDPCLLGSKEKEVTIIVIYDSEGLPVASHPPKRLRADYGTTGGSCYGGSVFSFPTLPFMTSSVTASPLKEGGDRTDSVCAPVMTEATTVATVSTTVAIPTDVSKDKSSGFDAWSIRAEEVVGAGSEEIYVPEWTVTRGFELNDGHLCANMIDHFTSPAFFKTVRGMEHAAGLESTIAEKDHELFDLGTSSSSLKSQNQSLVNQVHELEISSADLREKLEMLVSRSMTDFHPGVVWLSSEFQSAPSQRRCGAKMRNRKAGGLAAGIEHGQAGRCLTDLEAYIPSAEDDFNSAIHVLRDLNFPLLQELSHKKDASTWDIMDLLCLDDTVAETLDICRGRVEKMERNLIERLPFLKDVFVSIDDPLSAEALIKPSAEVLATNVLSTVVIVPPTDPFIFVEDYENPDSTDVVPENATLGSESEGKIDASAGGGLTFSQLDDEARNVVL